MSDEKSENTNFNWEINSFSKSANNSPKNAELFNKNYLNPLLQQSSKIGWSEINLQTSMKKLSSTSRSRETSSMYSSLNLNPTSESSSAFRKRDLPESNHEIPAKKQKNSQCVMLKYFDGSSSDEVDEHFNKALNRDRSSKRSKLNNFKATNLKIIEKNCLAQGFQNGEGGADSYTNNKRIFRMLIILTVKGRENFKEIERGRNQICLGSPGLAFHRLAYRKE